MTLPITYRIGETDLSWPPDLAAYMTCHRKGTHIAREAALAFLKKYRACGSLSAFCRDGYDWGRLTIARAVQLAVQDAVDAGHYDVNEAAFTALDKEGLLIRPWQDAFQHVYDAFVDLETEKLGEEERRRIRKELRGRFVGGGFGLDAALWASLEAGAVNLVTGAAHSVFNALGNLVTSLRIGGRESAIYEDPETVRRLLFALQRCIHRIYFFLLPRRVLGLVPLAASKEDIGRAAAIMDNAVRGRIPRDKLAGPLLFVLQTMPLDPRPYFMLAPLIKRFDDMKALAAMMNTFAVPESALSRAALLSALREEEEERQDLILRAARGDLSARASFGGLLVQENDDMGLPLLWSAWAAGSPDALSIFRFLAASGRPIPFLDDLLAEAEQ